MSDAAEYAALQKLGVWSVLHHLLVVVGLDDEVACAADVGLYLVGDLAYVGDEAEVGAVGLDEVAHAVAAVVGHAKGGDGEGSELYGGAFLNVSDEVRRYLLVDAEIVDDADVDVLRAIDGQLEIVTEASYAFHVVGVVVGDEYVTGIRERDAILAAELAQHAQSDAGIDDESFAVSKEVIAVSAASASKTNEFHISFFLFFTKRAYPRRSGTRSRG